MAKKELDAPMTSNPKDLDAPGVSQVKDPYKHREHRVKYQAGYGAEGAARGKEELPSETKGLSPREKSEKDEDKANKKQKLQYSKTRPNPY
jgi:hypothetical protein